MSAAFLLLLGDHRRSLQVWSLLAVVSVGAGVWIGLEPGRLIDLTTVREWLDLWLQTGRSIFIDTSLKVDYPPHALVLLLPLHLVPAGSLTAVFLCASVLSNIAMAWMLADWIAREIRPAASMRERVIVAVMLLAWGAIRVGIWNGQTVALAIVAGVAAVRAQPTSPWLAGVALAIAASKPTLGIGFGLILLFRGAVRSVAFGVAVTLLLTAVFDLSVGQTPLTSLTQYADSLGHMYTGVDYVRGVTTVREFYVDLSGGQAWADTAFIAQGLVAFALLCVVVWRARGRPEVQALVPAACLLWMLLAMPHQRYYLVLLAPAIWMLIWSPALIGGPGARWPRPLGAVLVVFSVADGPLVVRLLAEALYTHVALDWYWLWWGSYVLAGVLIAMLFVLVIRAMGRVVALSPRRHPWVGEGN